jgi:hypothetical protein
MKYKYYLRDTTSPRKLEVMSEIQAMWKLKFGVRRRKPLCSDKVQIRIRCRVFENCRIFTYNFFHFGVFFYTLQAPYVFTRLFHYRIIADSDLLPVRGFFLLAVILGPDSQ